ncbi:CheW protein [Spirochaeta thermophila DSM 6578]|uniref:Chemotaxis protein CheW n=1 Tax=Winmispira thermophila (strain ATCC 700085 / DSM 6578 / Z-1203) TaxID=869211 RepID=G0GC29_WINT7|nr:chemotaxis protein CheW [Spirochaeta thermophila]AEJ60393.1 CheW protein [Spirochaeta thermophila DSM 6578]
MADPVLNKYLLFSLGEEHYGIPIAKVQEVVRYIPITRLHDTSRFLKGVVNLRGRIVPIIDLRLKFGFEERPYTDRTVFIVVEVLSPRSPYLVGLAVDAVEDVVEVPDTRVEKMPSVGGKMKSHYLYGLVQLGDRLVLLLNLEEILSTEEVVKISEKVETHKVSPEPSSSQRKG